MKIQIVYPEERWVSEDIILGWYRDAVDNKEIEESDHEVDLFEAIDLLDDAGIITSTGKVIGESERELAVLKKDGRSYTTRRVAGQALEVITLLKAKTASPLDWMECPVTKESCNCHGFCKRMAESSEKASAPPPTSTGE